LLGRGLLNELPRLVHERISVHRYALITDETVESLYARKVQEAMGDDIAGLFVFSPGEPHKTCATWEGLSNQMLSAGMGRDSAVLAIGGGVAGDLAGFVAATYHRGIPCVQVPTSLLAMIDSSVGGKTGVDTSHGKNLIGAFHQPSLVAIDVATLETLPDRHLVAGFAEALKHGAIEDADYFEWMVATHKALRERRADEMLELVRKSVSIKSAVVSEDETEQGKRSVLNFGHTVGHAIEAASGFQLLHGEAVALGMLAEAEIGKRSGVTDQMACDALELALERFGLPKKMPSDLDLNHLVSIMKRDKKTRGGEVRMTFLERLGVASRTQKGDWTIPVPESAIIESLSQLA